MLRKKNVASSKKNTTTAKLKRMEDRILFNTLDQLDYNFSRYFFIYKLVKKIMIILFFFIFSSFALADSEMELGFEIYTNKAECGSCHALQAANSKGNVGPNLDHLKPTKARIIHAVKNGIGVMPAWDDILTPEEIEAVAHYVFESTNP